VIDIQLNMSMRGLPAWLSEGGERRAADMRAALRRIDKQVLSAWARSGGASARPGLGDRFHPGKQGRFGFAPRDDSTQKAKRRRYGQDIAYVSPNRKVHMRERVRVPGVGHRVSSRNGSAEVITRITLPGAAALNFSAKQNPLYRSQFIDTAAPGFAVDLAWINRERQRLFGLWLRDRIRRTRRRGKRGKGRAA
jgi:hypothetical protein